MDKLKYLSFTYLVQRLEVLQCSAPIHIIKHATFEHYDRMQLSSSPSIGLPERKQINTPIQFDTVKGNELILMRLQKGSVVDARQVFDKMPERKTLSWNTMIKGYAQHGLGKEALKLFVQMQWLNMKPDRFTYVYATRACILLSYLELGQQLHVQTVKTGHEFDVFVGSVLVEMYAKFENIDSSCKVFDEMPIRDMYSWNSLIVGYAQNGYVKNALHLFCQMKEEGMEPDGFSFGNILGVCAKIAAIEEGEQVHAQIIKAGFDSDVFVGSSLVESYVKSGNVELARKVFDKMHNPDIIAWNMMIAGYARDGCVEEALDLFLGMQLNGVSLNQYILASILSAFVNLKDLDQGQRVHALGIKIGFGSDVSLQNALITMYSKCGSTEDARRVLGRMHKRNVVSWTAMISGYVWNGYHVEAWDLFSEAHQSEIKLNHFALTSTLSALQFPEQGKQLHSLSIKTGFDLYVSVGNALVSMYAKCGNIDASCHVFCEIRKRDVVSWNAMIAGFVQSGHGELALKFFCKMQQEFMDLNQFTFASVFEACGILAALEESKQIHAHVIKSGFRADISMGTGLIDVYGKCGKMEDAKKLFNKISKQNVVTWNAMIGGYVQNNLGEEALKILYEMQGIGISPNQSTYASVLKACASLASMEQGKQVHTLIIETGFEYDVFVGSALVDMYAKCGSVEDAVELFQKMPDKNVVTWNVIITGFAQHGQEKEALGLFEQMQEARLKPNDITFLGVLYACCHAGLVVEGCQYFDSMRCDHGIIPKLEHYACIVDLFGRVGRLDEAGEFIKCMPFEPDALIWQIFLGACRIHGNVELGKHASQHLLGSQPQNAAGYVLLSNIYAAARRWSDVGKLRKTMKERGLKKDPGCSWIEVMKKVHSFVSEDKTHPQTEQIYAKLQELHRQMLEAGYVYDTNLLLQEEEHKEEILFHPSSLPLSMGS